MKSFRDIAIAEAKDRFKLFTLPNDVELTHKNKRITVYEVGKLDGTTSVYKMEDKTDKFYTYAAHLGRLMPLDNKVLKITESLNEKKVVYKLQYKNSNDLEAAVNDLTYSEWDAGDDYEFDYDNSILGVFNDDDDLLSDIEDINTDLKLKPKRA